MNSTVFRTRSFSITKSTQKSEKTRLEEEHRLGMHHQRRSSNEKNKQFQHICAGVEQNEFEIEFNILEIITCYFGDVFPVSFNPNTNVLTSGSADETIKLWNPTTGDLLRTMTGHTNSVWSVSSEASKTFISGLKIINM